MRWALCPHFIITLGEHCPGDNELKTQYLSCIFQLSSDIHTNGHLHGNGICLRWRTLWLHCEKWKGRSFMASKKRLCLFYFDGLLQKRRNSSVSAVVLYLFCIKPSIFLLFLIYQLHQFTMCLKCLFVQFMLCDYENISLFSCYKIFSMFPAKSQPRDFILDTTYSVFI